MFLFDFLDFDISLIENLVLRLLNQNYVYNAEDTAEKLTGGVFRKKRKGVIILKPSIVNPVMPRKCLVFDKTSFIGQK